MADAAGLSGHAVRGLVNAPGQPEAVARADLSQLEQTVYQTADYARQALNMAGQAMGEAVDTVSDKAFQAAANTGMPPGTGLGETAFSWSGYIQALGVMCLLLAGLWFLVWALRRYGKFNFLPRPGALPRDSLIMEAQMPLGPRKGLMVVRFMNRRLLLGVTDHRISLLAEDYSRNRQQDDGNEDAGRAGNDQFEEEFEAMLARSGGHRPGPAGHSDS